MIGFSKFTSTTLRCTNPVTIITEVPPQTTRDRLCNSCFSMIRITISHLIFFLRIIVIGWIWYTAVSIIAYLGPFRFSRRAKKPGNVALHHVLSVTFSDGHTQRGVTVCERDCTIKMSWFSISCAAACQAVWACCQGLQPGLTWYFCCSKVIVRMYNACLLKFSCWGA